MESSESYVLKVSGLTVEFQNQTILDNVSFSLKKGTILSIVGPNGAGKTVLLRTLINLVKYKGKIEWAEKVKIGYVPQLLYVRDIPISVREFLSFKNGSKIESSLASVGLDSKALLNKSLGTLSGGQLRRVLIAWAILDKPDVLLFDEPTTGVDIDSEEAIYGMLKKLSTENKITLLLISHDLHIIREYSDYVLAINKCVTFFGESKEVMDPATQKIIYGEPICREFGDFHG
ncbi:MAG: metal ABC transporter ATP-binding protein [Candidatus Bathyarchaeota archaeon]